MICSHIGNANGEIRLAQATPLFMKSKTDFKNTYLQPYTYKFGGFH